MRIEAGSQVVSPGIHTPDRGDNDNLIGLPGIDDHAVHVPKDELRS